MSDPILVTGGAGSVGRRVTERLRSQGHTVRVFDLPSMNYAGLEGEKGIEVVKGDLTRAESVQPAVKGVGGVIHLAALLPPISERSRERTFAVNTEGTKIIAGALKSASPGAPLVFSSSVSTYGDTSKKEPPVKIDAPRYGLDIYAESKIAAEEYLRKNYQEAVILRISGISVPVIQAPPEVWPFTADERLEFVHRDDVMAALCASVTVEEAKGHVFNIAGGKSWRMTGKEYVRAHFDLMGVPIEEANFLDSPGYFDWYDTEESQRILRYQNHTFGAYMDQLKAEIKKMMG